LKPLKIAALGLLGLILTGAPSFGAGFGRMTLKAGEVRRIEIGASDRNLRICNDSASSGMVLVTVGDRSPHSLSPGLCAEDMGARITVQAVGQAVVDFKSTCDSSSMD
jgi:hypothetical protein